MEKDYHACGLNTLEAMDCMTSKEQRTINDHDECEWVNVSSGTVSPGLSETRFIEP